jgi:CheY-like chemotaxis protein
MLKEAMPRNISFELQLDPQLPEIHADPGQVERVIINLATNARDAMPEGGKIIFGTSQVRGGEIPFHSPEEKEQYLCLRVEDTGFGMDEATRQRIFEPFFTTKSRGKGTGLGMPVVYGLMQSHNGLIDVQSEPGKGTSISLFFPIPTGPAPRNIELPSVPPQAVDGTETVLIVDDEPDVRYFLEVILKARGYGVISARDAEEALDLIQGRQDKIHLVFSDVGLPKLDGFALSNQAKSLHPGLKTVLTSGYTDGSLKTKMAELGIDGFISKPYDANALLQTIRGILDKE